MIRLSDYIPVLYKLRWIRTAVLLLAGGWLCWLAVSVYNSVVEVREFHAECDKRGGEVFTGSSESRCYPKNAAILSRVL